LPLAEQLTEARKHFEKWYPSAIKFKREADFLAADGGPKEAAFAYHQSVGRLCHCALLVLTLYSQLCRARHKGDYAKRRTMPMPSVFPPAMRRLGELRAA
jgi:uncharacterized protein